MSFCVQSTPDFQLASRLQQHEAQDHMLEGWHDDEYIILFEGDEALAIANACEFNAMLPDFSVLGLRSWQDFIVRDQAGATFTIPSVPLDTRYIASFYLPDPSELQPDAQLVGKIKWLVKPLEFGGSPEAEDNVSWVTHQQHGELVRWWKEQCRSAKASQADDRLDSARSGHSGGA
jgi:hypothetical protein